MTKVISLINMKGGVGKTTLTVALSEFLAEEKSKAVLVIDLDPQTNATVALIDQERWKELDKSRRTLAQLYLDVLNGSRYFDPDNTIITSVSNIHGGIDSLSLLPSSLRLIDIEDKLPLIPSLTHYTINPVDILKTAISPRLGSYDYVLIDCPPNLGLMTQSGLRISDWFLIPVIPDILSTLGIPQILEQVRTYAKNWGNRPVPLGIIITKYRAIRLHETISNQLHADAKSGKYPRIFNAVIRESSQTETAMEFGIHVNTLKQKYGYGGYYEAYEELVSEFLEVS